MILIHGSAFWLMPCRSVHNFDAVDVPNTKMLNYRKCERLLRPLSYDVLLPYIYTVIEQWSRKQNRQLCSGAVSEAAVTTLFE